MRQKDTDNYGGLKVNQETEVDPTTQEAADLWNERKADQAALTQLPWKAWVHFTTTTSVGVMDPSLVQHASIWGSGDGQKPSVERLAGTGLYTISYAASFFLGYAEEEENDEEETVSFKSCLVQGSSSTAADTFHDSRKLTIVGSVVDIVTKSNGVAANVGNSSAAVFLVDVYLN